jgi:hypothetical protein
VNGSAHLELQAFLRAHRNAWPFAAKATNDYLLARIGMPRGLWSAFEVAGQATEKLLKAYILFRNGGSIADMRSKIASASKARGRKGERLHDIEAAFAVACQYGMRSPDGLQARLARINLYHDQRYRTAQSSSTRQDLRSTTSTKTISRFGTRFVICTPATMRYAGFTGRYTLSSCSPDR